jgi:hypothetical protein
MFYRIAGLAGGNYAGMTEGYALARYGTQETGAMSIIVEITIIKRMLANPRRYAPPPFKRGQRQNHHGV